MSDRSIGVSRRAPAAATVASALCAMLAASGVVRGAEPVASGLTLDQPIYLQTEPSAPAGETPAPTPPAPPAAPRRPLMLAFEKIGIAKPLDDAGINIFGFV